MKGSDFIKNIIEQLAKKLYKQQKNGKNIPLEVYSYGLQLVFQNLFIIASILIISALIDSIGKGIIYIVIYVSLKVTCGGYHAKKAIGCYFVSIINYLLVVFINTLLANCQVNKAIFLMMYMVLCLYLFFNRPLINRNHKVRQKAIKKNKYISIVILSVILIFLLFCYVTEYNYLLSYIVLIILSIVLGIIVGRKEGKKYV